MKEWLLQESKRSISLTYSTLARSVGAQRFSTRAYQGYLSAVPHTIGNFAIDLKLDPWVVRELAAFSSERDHMQVYHLPTDEPSHASELLVAGGFEEKYSLELFGLKVPILANAGLQPPDLEIIPAIEHHVRLRTMESVAAEFLPRASIQSRNWMVEATVKSRELQLFNMMREGKWVGSFLLSDFGDSIGLYNLCITAKLRGKGFGTAAVHWVAARALESRKAMILQCDSALARWYCELGFLQIGRMRTYCLTNAKSPL